MSVKVKKSNQNWAKKGEKNPQFKIHALLFAPTQFTYNRIPSVERDAF